MSWSYITSHIIDLTRFGQFLIITHPKVDFLLIIRHLTHLTFSINLYNQLFESSFLITLHSIGNATGLWYVTFSDVYTWKGVLLLTKPYIIQVINFLIDRPLIKS